MPTLSSPQQLQNKDYPQVSLGEKVGSSQSQSAQPDVGARSQDRIDLDDACYFCAQGALDRWKLIAKGNGL